MRLERIYIDGFGVFHDLLIEGLSPGLTVFLGHNESGKTTLLSFVRTLLFGFPRGKENPYPPLAGGMHGGNVTLTAADGEVYQVERRPGPHGGRVNVFCRDRGTSGGRELLERLLGTASRTLYRNVYAFSLSELQHFETLNDAALREALYSAGAGLDSHVLNSFKGRLEKWEDRLYKPRGNKPRINSLLRRLREIRKEKQALHGNLDRYDEIRSRISELEGKIAKIEEERIGLSRDLGRIETRIRAWQDWVHIRVTAEKLESLPTIDDFPADGVARLDTLSARLADVEKSRLEKQEDLERLEGDLSDLKRDPGILALKEEIGRIQMGQGRFEALCQELQSLRLEIAGAERRLQEDLERLGPGWGEDRILSFDLSIALAEEVRRQGQALARAERELQGRRAVHEGIVSRLREAEEAFGVLQAGLRGDWERLEEKERACRRLARFQHRLEFLERDLGHLKERLEECREEQESLLGALETGKGRRQRLIPLLLALGLLALAWAAYGREVAPEVLLPGILLLLALLFWVFRRETPGLARIQARLRDLKGRVEDLEERKSSAEKERESILEEMDKFARILGVGEVPDPGVLEEIERGLADQADARKAWRRAQEEVDRIRRRREESLAELEAETSRWEEIQGRWERWLEERGLDPGLTPEGALEVIGLIRSCREQIQSLERLRDRLGAAEEERSVYVSLVNEVMARSGEVPGTGKDIEGRVQGIVERYREAEQAEQRWILITREISLCRESMKRLQERAAALEARISDLLAAGGADHEEEFRKRAGIFEKRRALEGELEIHKDNLKRLAGHSEDLAALEKNLSETSLEELERSRAELAERMGELVEIRDLLKKEQATLEEQARQLIRDDRMSALRSEEEDLRAELAELAEQWAVIRIARNLLQGAAQRYERERQPAVIREAGRFFKILTLGAYSAIVAPLGEDRIHVVRRDGGRREIGELSRGTAEQLYLSLRFGFIREFSRRSEPLPVIMDDILVNFDPPRARAAARAISELSLEHQTLFFTCHPVLAGLFKELDQRIPVLEISEGKIKGHGE
ncbi:MAG: AAA family ATPase [Deltaproteobacteria bacterium]|nr:AAA family ATPase [Deltaproteobacteria bacterium]